MFNWVITFFKNRRQRKRQRRIEEIRRQFNSPNRKIISVDIPGITITGNTDGSVTVRDDA